MDVTDQRRSRVESGGRTLAERPVGPVRVVVLDVLGEDCFEVTPSEDEHPVKALAPDGADHALADGVRPRGLDRGLNDPGTLGGENGVERRGELRVAIS